MPGRMTSALALFSALLLAAPTQRPRVVLDPGHGGAQQGAISPDGHFEKSIALDVAKRLKAALEKDGDEVLLTREQDVLLALGDRVTFANKAQPDLFISLHLNSMPTRRLRANRRASRPSSSPPAPRARTRGGWRSARTPTPASGSSAAHRHPGVHPRRPPAQRGPRRLRPAGLRRPPPAGGGLRRLGPRRAAGALLRAHGRGGSGDPGRGRFHLAPRRGHEARRARSTGAAGPGDRRRGEGVPGADVGRNRRPVASTSAP